MKKLAKKNQEILDRLIEDLEENPTTKVDLLIYMLASKQALFEQTGHGTSCNIENILRGANSLERLVLAISPTHEEKFYS